MRSGNILFAIGAMAIGAASARDDVWVKGNASTPFDPVVDHDIRLDVRGAGYVDPHRLKSDDWSR